MKREPTGSMERERPESYAFVSVMSFCAGCILLLLAVRFVMEGHLTRFTAGLGVLGTAFVAYSYLWAKEISILRLAYERLM